MDAEDFTAMTIREQPRLIRFCYRLLGSHEEAEDATQTVLLRAWIARATIRTDADSQARLLMTIARNLCYDRLKHRAVVERHVRAARLTYAPDPAAIVLHNMDLVALDAAMGRLDPRHKDALALLGGEYSGKERAAAMGLTVAGVKSLSYRARERLRAGLAA
jgi:RNA polymerase sigma factor (sigma-70 family)